MYQDNYASGDEISLVDLATILLRRIKLFIGLFLLFVVGGVVFALIQGEQYEYVSLYQIAEMERDRAVEKPAKAIAVLESQKLPETKALYKAEHEARMPFGVSFSNPENTALIRVTSDASRESSEDVKAIHNELLSYLKARHENLLGSVQKSLDARLKSVQRTLDVLAQTPDAGQAVAEVMQKQGELEEELATLVSSEVLVVARESVERVAPNRKVIVVISGMLGFIFAILAVYFAEFATIVRRTMQSQKQL